MDADAIGLVSKKENISSVLLPNSFSIIFFAVLPSNGVTLS
jgi:hypothetical protein